MMNLNSNHSVHGFTLIETLLAMALVALCLGPVVDLQSITARHVLESAQRLDRLFTAYDFFLLHTGGEDELVTKTNNDPEVTLRYEREPVYADSRLAKEFNHLFIEIVSWQWQGDRGTIHDRFACIQFMPPEKEQKQAAPATEPQKKPAAPAAPAKPGATKPPAPAGAKK
jgi:prepilin-type N-terminal cleavage/methylation domain-containing protein